MSKTFLILHGLGGSSNVHWQSWLASRLSAQGFVVRYPKLLNPDAPLLEEWIATVDGELASFPAGAPPTVICHSLAVLLWLHYAGRCTAPVAERVILVAPPGPSASLPQIATFFPPPLDPAALRRSTRSVQLICSDGDPYCTERAAECYGRPLGLTPTLLPPKAGHINTASGFGPWPMMESICRDDLLPAGT
jgi:predicted alpha/beta hydrolase family esterase